MEGMGLGMLVEQLGELKLGELLDTPPPGLDEAIAISKVMQFLESQEYSMFTRIVFDTAPTVSKSGVVDLIIQVHQLRLMIVTYRAIPCDFCHCQTSLMHP
uniref:Uncharacterized protein n=1 Tax=Rhizophora mucronata TaxID=61149 RepID=A0A2P2KMR3_RHIMU